MLYIPTSPRVHAVIVHHRGLEMLDDCLRSLLDSAAVDLQIIIVSNGCQEPLPQIAELSPRIHVTTPPQPVGFSEANNIGAAWAKKHLGETDAYYFVNNDTESKPATLDVLLRAMDEHEAAVAGPLTLIHAAPDHINSVGIRITEDAGAWDDGIGLSFDQFGDLPDVREVAAVTGSALLIDAQVFDQIGGWNEVYEWYYEDIDLCLRVWKRGLRVIHVPQAVILHRISATMSEGSERKLFYFRRNRLLIGLLHWPADVLRTLLWRAFYHEIIRAPWVHSAMQRRALGDIVKNLPRYWRLRRRGRGDDSWRRFIEPLGSVPVITLPELTTAEDSLPPTAGLARTPKSSAATGSGSNDAVSAECFEAAQRFEAVQRFEAARRFAADGVHQQRFLVLGWGPLPMEEAKMHFAPGGRTWQFAKALAGDGHSVVVATARMPGTGLPIPQDAEPEAIDDHLLLYRFERECFEHQGILEALVEAFQPDAIVAAAPVPSERAVRLGSDLPIWVDLFGDPICEAQAKAMVEGGEGDHLSAYLKLLNAVLDRADIVSTVSERQRWAVIGQLGLAGRLNAAVGGTALVHTVPCASLAPENEAPQDDDGSPDENAESTFEPPEDAIVALWSGSFNTWCDIDTLFAGVEAAMEREPHLIFVATGGAVAGHDEKTFDALQRHLEESQHRERWHLLGSLPRDEFARLRTRADFGVVTEKTLYERLLGSSGRILDWLTHGRPVVCTALSEIGGMVGHGGFGIAYEPGDSDDLSQALLHMCGLSAAERLAMGDAGRRHVRTHLSIHSTATPLRRWAVAPQRAPDVGFPRPDYLLAAGREAVREEFQAALDEASRYRAENLELSERNHQIRAELGQIHLSSMWKLWTAYHGVRRFFTRLIPGAGS